jgi:hypothetical protein
VLVAEWAGAQRHSHPSAFKAPQSSGCHATALLTETVSAYAARIGHFAPRWGAANDAAHVNTENA